MAEDERAVAFAREASLGMPGSIKDVADFLLSEGTGIANLTMAQIATRAYTSKPTLVRFAKRAGYSGWREYRRDFIEAMQREEAERAARANVDVNYPFGEHAEQGDVSGALLRIHRLALCEVERCLDDDVLARAARAVTSARNVLFLGAMQNRERGLVFATNLWTIGVLCHVPASEAVTPIARHLGPGDCVVVASYSGDLSHGSMRYVPQLKQRGVAVVAITNSQRGPLRQCADHVLCFAPLEHYHDKIGAFYSGACTSAMLDLLYAACYATRYEQSQRDRASVVRELRGIVPDELEP